MINLLKKLTCVLFFISLIYSPAKSEESINLQGYYFSDAYRYAVLEDSGIVRFPGKYVFTTSVAYVNTPLIVSDPASQNKLVDYLDNFWIGTVGASLYVSSIFSVGMDLNYLSTTYSDSQPTGFGYEDKRGKTVRDLGDITLRAKIRLFRDVGNKIGIAFIPKVDLATGSPVGFSTDDSTRLTGLLVFEKYWENLSLLLSGGYSTSSSAVYKDIDYRELLPLGFGLSWKIDNKWNVNIESSRQIALNGGNKQDSGDYYVTLKGRIFKQASFYTGLGIAGFNDVDKDNWTLLAGLKFHDEQANNNTVAVAEATPTPEPEIFEPEPLPTMEPKTPVVIQKREEEKLLGSLLVTDRVYFDNGSSAIKRSEAKKLDKVVDSLIENEKKLTKVIIEGYASKVGPSKLNQKLSLERSNNVLVYLKRKGVNPKILQTVYYGDNYLNEEPEHWMNRRVEFRVYVRKN